MTLDASRKRTVIVIILLTASVSLLSYLLWPFEYTLTITNSKGNEVVSDVTIEDENGNIIVDSRGGQVRENLWKGVYIVTIHSNGYEIEKFEIDNRIGFDAEFEIRHDVVLEPIVISLNMFRFYDPTKTIRLSPEFLINGTDILGDAVNSEINVSSKVIYGNYTVAASTENFGRTFSLLGEKIVVNETKTDELTLGPNENFMVIDGKEVGYILNFLGDYLILSSDESVIDFDKGFPKQFYLYKKDHVVSMGDMVFLMCERRSYEISGADPTFFVPLDKNFRIAGSSENETDCYASALNGNIPSMLGGTEVSDFVFNDATGSSGGTNLEMVNLNSKERKVEVAFSFDIEAGRYVRDDNKGDGALSPCDRNLYSLGLDQDEIICDDADKIAWFSGLFNSTEDGYPWSSAVQGYRDIVSYSERYGIPVTHFIVQRDYKALGQLYPETTDYLREMVDKDLVEIGSHTRYHSNFETLDAQEILEDMRESKIFFEGEFNMTIEGFRAPYHRIGDYGDFVEALRSSGYSYWSNNPTSFDSGEIQQKPYNFAMTYSSISRLRSIMSSQERVVTLAHPWNLYYDEYTISGETYLRRNDTNAKLSRSSILTAISEGGVPLKLKDLNVN